tara:strand:+ start:152 stop:367 length:216 start_codon:yes stop_codon:yes gene_type:complete
VSTDKKDKPMKKIDEYKIAYESAAYLAEEARLKAVTRQASVRLSDIEAICQSIDHMNVLVDDVVKNFKVSK